MTTDATRVQEQVSSPGEQVRRTVADGYRSGFLGVEVPLPRPRTVRPVAELPYTHFTVLLDTGRRLAVSTGVNVDGTRLREVDRDDDWRLDPRVAAEHQAGAALYAGNDLDRGHLVRRRDPVWGDPAIAEQASADTFYYPNAAPQAAHFNQSKELWLGLEDHVLSHADVHDLRLSVFTGPVLDDDDPEYRGVQIPRRFYKVAAWATGDGELAATGYVLDQTPQLGDVGRQLAPSEEPPPLGPFRTFQVPIADIAELTGLDLDLLVAGDRLVTTVGALEVTGWLELTAADDIRL